MLAGGAPALVQGGMGVAVSDWRLARAVARRGQLGTVSGTALAVVAARRLQRGDAGGHMRRALAQLPLPGVAERVLERYFVAGGIAAGRPFASVPRPTVTPRRAWTELTVAACFAEVWLAKEGHDGPVAVNLLHKVRLPTAASLYGALLAGVDVVAMGAGIPRDVPALLDRLARNEPVVVRLEGGAEVGFDPSPLWAGAPSAPLRRPPFVAIVASATLAAALAREPATRPDGFVVEGPVAGGHNAPPRGKLRLDAVGEPQYGPRDAVDPAALARLGLPFWLAGGCAGPELLAAARAQGAAGVQVGTAFALCEESGLAPPLRGALLDAARAGRLRVRTDPRASPTGFPFKIAQLPGSLAQPEVADARPRRCDLGFLSETFARADGRPGYRCAAEPVTDYTRKGGDAADTHARLCLCNGLLAAAGLAQQRPGTGPEPALVTCGDDLSWLPRLLPDGRDRYTAADVIDYMLPPPKAAVRG